MKGAQGWTSWVEDYSDVLHWLPLALFRLTLTANQNMVNYFGKSKDDANSGNGSALIPHLQPSTSTLIPPKDNSAPKIYKPLAPIVSF